MNDLLWAPHWTQTWFSSPYGYSRFLDALPVMTKFLEANPSVSVTFRPHPILNDAIDAIVGELEPDSREVRSVALDIKDHKSNIELFLSKPNMKRSTRTMIEDIHQHHALLTDGISIIAYWAVTGKKIAVMRDEHSPPFNSLGRALSFFLPQLKDRSSLEKWLVSVRRAPSRGLVVFRSLFFQLFFFRTGMPGILKVAKMSGKALRKN